MKRNRRVMRVVAIVLVALLAGGAVVSALLGALALAEAAPAAQPLDRQELKVEYLEDEQALHISQRLVYTNRTGARLEAVVFYAAGNLFRRQSALMYESDDLAGVFPHGYAPAGIDLRSVHVDSAAADYGFQGEEELYLRVACDLEPGETGCFEFDYYLLLMACNAFQGVGDTEVRVADFCFVPGVYDDAYGEFQLKRPLYFTRWVYADAADYAAEVILPEGWTLAASGEETLVVTQGEKDTWRVEASAARDFALCFSKRWRASAAVSDGGVRVRVLAGARSVDRAARVAAKAVSQCEAWFGEYPVERLDLVQSDDPMDAMGHTGLAWLPGELFDPGREAALDQALRLAAARQVFGLAAYAEPSADAWMSDSLCAYLSYLMLEDAEGRDAFLKAVNRDWVSELQHTVPGGLNVTSDAALFDSRSYDTVVRTRGAVVFHELRQAMGLEAMLSGLRRFCEMAGPCRTLTEMDLVHALDGDGGDWEDFLTDWVFNVGEYVNQNIDWFE